MKVRNLLVGLFISAQIFAVDYFHCDKCGKNFKIDESIGELIMKSPDGKILGVRKNVVCIKNEKGELFISRDGAIFNDKIINMPIDFDSFHDDIEKEIRMELEKCEVVSGTEN